MHKKTNTFEGVEIIRYYDESGKLAYIIIKRTSDDYDIQDIAERKLGKKLVMKIIAKLIG